MKGFPRLFLVLVATVAMLVSACGGASAIEGDSSVGGNKPLASLVEVQGYIEAISGNQWTINGQVVTVDLSMLDDDNELGDYQVGDYIEIKAEVSTDGSLVAREVDSSDDGNENDDSNSNDDGLGGIGNDNSNDNDDDSNSNDDDDSNDNDDDSNSNDDDDSNGNGDDSNSNDDDDSNNNNDDSNSNDDNDSNDNDDDLDDDDDNDD